MDEILFTPVTVIASAIQQRLVSACTVLDAYLQQIYLYNPSLHAIVALDEEGARRRAIAADEALERGEIWGPLHGVPVTLEDAHATANIRSTFGGYPPFANHIPTEDGTMPTRLKAAGAVLLGKTSGPEIWEDESVFPRTNNPWDLQRSPGGSSSGPAAAVAAGLTALDIGLDSFGSIQNPAHWCGVYGMRPTEHRVPITGALFIDPVRKFRVLSTTGPIARNVADLRLALQIIMGPDGCDTEVPPVSWHEALRPDLRVLRIAWTATLPDVPVAYDIRTGIEKLVQEVERRGVQVKQCLPDINFVEQAALGLQLFPLIAGTFAPPSNDTPRASLDDYLLALHRRDSFINAWEQFFTHWDALIAPVGVCTAPLQVEEQNLIVEGTPISEEQSSIPIALSPVSGCPTVVLPVGKDRNGLPFGVQVMGRRWDDERLLMIAEMLSEITGGFQRPPGY